MTYRSKRSCPRGCKPLLAYAYAGTNMKMVRAKERIHRQVEEWRRNPGGVRGGAKRVTRHLIVLINWADSMFRLGTMESTHESLQWYLLAAAVMGPGQPRVAATPASPRALVRDRLGKMRNGQTIDGAKRILPLWDQPIDPALLERADSMGISPDYS